MYDMGRQAAQRLRMWMEEMPAHLYTPVGTAEFRFFTTAERLSAEEADRHESRPCPPGTAWGMKWEYAWFAGDAVLPEGCEGRRVILLSGTGGEQLVYANGRAVGSIDRNHSYVTLTRKGRAGERFHLQIESYAGHGPRLETLGPCPPERPAIAPVEAPQCRTEQSVIAVWNEEAYQLMMDAEALEKLLRVLPDRSLRAMKVAKALQRFTQTADFEIPDPAEREKSFREARTVLREALECRNGSTAPVMWVLGQSHIDLGWLWPVEETFHKSVRTYSNQLALMEEYPEYRFLLCEPALLDMLKERDPEVWNRVREAARRGQMVPEGAFYVECDTNLPSGESLIRQLMYGLRWFREEMGTETQVAWQPDTFGFTAALPQILKKMGIRYFATEKLLRADPETQRFPWQNFVWEGLDGSTVEALSFFKANAPVDPSLLHRRWEQERTQETGIDTMLYTFGYGDGGGGATRDMLEMLRRTENLEGAPRTRWGGLREFFEETSRQAEGNRWTGELYLAWHRGTLTSQRRQKAAMRRAEFALAEAERLLAMLPEEAAARKDRMEALWKKLMLNQFHDIAGGVGIARVHREAERDLREIREELEPLCDGWRRSIFGVRDGEGTTLINPLPWPRKEWVTLPDGREIYACLPPAGAVTAEEAAEEVPETIGVTETEEGWIAENRMIRLRLGRDGVILGLKDLETGTEMLESGQRMNDWRLYRNIQTVYDAWEMDRNWREEIIPGAVEARTELTRRTPFLAEFTVERKFGNSSSVQKIRIRSNRRLVEFDTEVDWQERRKMLKAHFESNILCENAVHEIQFGQIARPCHHSHPFAADRYEVCNHRYSALCEAERGFVLLNDGIYGISSDRGELALTLLRAPLVPDDTCDRGRHHFVYALMPFAGSLVKANPARAGYELNVPAAALKGRAEKRSGIWCEGESVLLEAVKPAEDGNGLILRLYESMGTAGEGCLHLPFTGEVYACAMTEEKGESLGTGDLFRLRLKPYEIVTLRAVPEGKFP